MELVPNLPDEIGRECLLRACYKSHHNLKGVCRSWRSLVKSPRFYEQRKAKGIAEHCIFIVQALPREGGEPCANNNSKQQKKAAAAHGIAVYDPLRGAWERLPPIPQFPNSIPLFSKCVSVRQKLILIGGWHPSKFQAINSVFIYDVLSGRWSQGADMPTVRSFFGCCVSEEGTVYVAGGHDEDKNALRTVEAYDVEKDEWESLPAMSKGRDECEAVWMEGKLIVISGYETESQGQFQKSAEAFDPLKRTWIWLENMWGVGQCPRSCVAALGRLYYLSKKGVMQYNSKENVWDDVGIMPEGIRASFCGTVLCHDKIFVSGSGSDKMMYCYAFEEANGKWVEIQRPQGFAGFVQCATTLEL